MCANLLMMGFSSLPSNSGSFEYIAMLCSTKQVIMHGDTLQYLSYHSAVFGSDVLVVQGTAQYFSSFERWHEKRRYYKTIVLKNNATMSPGQKNMINVRIFYSLNIGRCRVLWFTNLSPNSPAGFSIFTWV